MSWTCYYKMKHGYMMIVHSDDPDLDGIADQLNAEQFGYTENL